MREEADVEACLGSIVAEAPQWKRRLARPYRYGYSGSGREGWDIVAHRGGPGACVNSD